MEAATRCEELFDLSRQLHATVNDLAHWAIATKTGVQHPADVSTLLNRLDELAREMSRKAAPVVRPEEAEAQRLLDEVHDANLHTLSKPHFQRAVELFAARARALQTKLGIRGRSAPEVRTINMLNRFRADRGIEGIWGLARHHEDDWSGRVARLQERPPPSNASPSKAKACKPQPAPERLQVPQLRRASCCRPVVILGGEVRGEKLRTLRCEGELDGLQWVPNDKLATVPGRIKQGAISGIILLEQLVSHSPVKAILEAARAHELPIAYAARGGLASLRDALTELNVRLA